MYNAAYLLDYLIEEMNLKNDAALARALDLTPPAISKFRHGSNPIGPNFLISAHEVSDIPIAKLKELAGLPAATPFRQVAR